MLDNFDAVLILERLSSEEGRDEAEALLRRAPADAPRRACVPPRLPLHKVNEGSVRKRAEPLSREDRLRIVALNPLDLELYRHAVTVHKERVVECHGAVSYPHKLHFGSRSRPQLNMGRRGVTKLRADGLPLWSGGVPRVSGDLLSGADLRVLLSSSPPSLSSICNAPPAPPLPFASVFNAASVKRPRVDPSIPRRATAVVHGAKASTVEP